MRGFKRGVGWRTKAKREEGGNGKVFCRHQMQQVRRGLGVDTCTHVIIDSTLKALYMDLLFSNAALYAHYKVRDKCPHARDTHTQTLCSYTLGAWIITRIY